ncbi:uncharacterized protein EI90DRAFT_3124810 [Cantharellus anzutake]|uniref:uncharacterized protein n=1 Tax=Cantharellus anzutake TaxID=1750568 RepID=UPI001905594E|nr:uncharacterized protein EI90DRAFT_3124810 [Cantharellus anzutake]KAF8330019.1 hypothetical protein EI90DRAFT_3124810 [Cantharellus anzutake]
MAAQFNTEKQEAIKDMALVDNNQAVAMKRLEGELRGTIDLAQHAGIFCFVGMVSGEPSNVAAHGRNIILFNDSIVQNFLHDHCKLKQLESDFYSYVLTHRGQGDAVMREKQELWKQKRKMETSTRDHARQAFGQTFKGCFSPPLDLIPWKTLPLMLIKQKVAIHNCPPNIFLDLIHEGGDYAKVEQWRILYDAVGGEAPAERYAEYGKNPSLKLVDVVPWSAEDGACIPNSKDYKDIVLLRDNQGAGGHQGHVLLTIRDVSGLLSMNEAPGLADIQLTTSIMAVQNPCSLPATLNVSPSHFLPSTVTGSTSGTLDPMANVPPFVLPAEPLPLSHSSSSMFDLPLLNTLTFGTGIPTLTHHQTIDMSFDGPGDFTWS